MVVFFPRKRERGGVVVVVCPEALPFCFVVVYVALCWALCVLPSVGVGLLVTLACVAVWLGSDRFYECSVTGGYIVRSALVPWKGD